MNPNDASDPNNTLVRIEALRAGRVQWGCDGFIMLQLGTALKESETNRNMRILSPWSVSDGPSKRVRVHIHDAFCALPRPLECVLAGVKEPKTGWGFRA